MESMNHPHPQHWSLPIDLILQILARLPIKSLLRCRSVCKSWRRLISDDHFIRLHFHSSSSNPAVVIEILETSLPASRFVSVNRFGVASPFSLDFLRDRVKVRASSHGLLCCASITNRGSYYICNPVTMVSRLLPRTRERPFTRCQPDYEATLVGLAFDPSESRFHVALAGFPRPFGGHPQDQLACLVFDSKTNSWSRFVASHHAEFTQMNRNQVVFSGGALHWLTHCCSYVLTLHLLDMVWGKITLPDEILAMGSGARIYLLDLEGSVSVVHISGVWMCIWVLKDPVTERWDLVDRVHLRCIRGIATSAFPVSQTKDVVFLAAQKKILTYGRKDKVWREIYAVKDNYVYPLWFSALAFRSSLFSCQ